MYSKKEAMALRRRLEAAGYTVRLSVDGNTGLYHVWFETYTGWCEA